MCVCVCVCVCVCLINDIFESLEFVRAARKCLFIDTLFIDTFLRKQSQGVCFLKVCVCV